MKFKLLYCSLLILTLVFGGVHAGSSLLSIRNVSMIVMLLICYKETNEVWMQKYFQIYLLFISFFGLGSLVHGYFPEYLKYVIGYYFACYIWCWATEILIYKYDSKCTLIYTLLAIGAIDVFFTIAQYYHFDMAFNLSIFLNIDDEERISGVLETYNGVLNRTSLPGILGPVYNGYFLAVCSIIVLFFMSERLFFITIILWAFYVFGLYCVMQRAAIIAGIVPSLFYIIMYCKNKVSIMKKLILFSFIFSVGIYLLFYGLNMSDEFNNSRYASYDWNNRSDVFDFAIHYIEQNFIFANYYDMMSKTDMPPHNLFMNSIVFGTFFGALAVMYLIFRHLLLSLKIIIEEIRTIDDNKDILFSLAGLAYFVISLTHNNSIVTGDVLFWLLAVPVFCYSKINSSVNT